MKPAACGNSETLHASAVSLGGHAALITGTSGAGKSALALQMMALGAGLIADDRVEVFMNNATLHARVPATLPPLIEARGIGLLRANLQPAARIIVIVDLDAAPAARLPPPLYFSILGHTLPMLAGKAIPHLAAALIQILTTGHVPHHD